MLPAVLFAAGLALGGGAVAAWALTDRPQASRVGPGAGVGSLKGPEMIVQPKRPVSVSDVVGVAPATPGPEDGSSVDALTGGAQAHKILARTLRREGKFDAAAQAAARYREVRLGDSP